ncbi:MAG: alpha/beta fold hydrolase [Chloroflexi bacterium]|nr:alpha/beta fold hydrolase [Chloroflexota bacterium]
MDISIGLIIASAIAGLAVIYLTASGILAGILASPAPSAATRDPASLGTSYEDVSFPSRCDRLLLRGWLMNSGHRGTVVVSHGGKSNRADQGIRLLEMCVDLVRRGFNVLTYDRRSCGASSVASRRCRAGLDDDLAGAVDFVRRRNGAGENIFLLGISLGAVATILFASHEEGIQGIVLDSGFARMVETVGRVLAGVNRLLPLFLPGALLIGRLMYGLRPADAISRVEQVACPALFIHGEDDRDIPAWNAGDLYQAAGHPLNELWTVPGAGHAQSYMTDPGRYIGRVNDFLEKCASEANTPRKRAEPPDKMVIQV